ncbi:cation:proton antiporter [Pseudoalteromonas sp. T1lg22]|uniref:cation:proton antiporter n=1 Tax=Pseudoalteromonas sp. T1lg22 TaxID=2077096 RepID=UPI000CF5E070|nr:cation:proton antiporter [Pseudoalteromonas sp. T1lg22]
MEYYIAILLALAFFIYSISFRQLARAELTGPMYFVLTGMVVAAIFLAEFKIGQPLEQLLPLVELTLAVVLFSDAAKTRLAILKRAYKYPVLLLFVALPLTFCATVLTGYLLFPKMSVLALALLAIILTPTDAALSKGILEAKAVPLKLREAINVESGLNDGLCVPIFLFLFLSWQLGSWQPPMKMLEFMFREVGIALGVATLITWSATYLIRYSARRHFFEKASSPFLILSLAIVNYSVAEALGGSGFVAAFVAGLLFDYLYRPSKDMQLIEESEHIAEFFSYLIWCLFGAYSYSQLQSMDLSWSKLAFALIAATLVRVIPVLFSLIVFNGLNFKEKFTLAWFGPRGLASIVFTLMVLDSADGLLSELATLTIMTSVFIHGITTRPIANSFRKKGVAKRN